MKRLLRFIVLIIVLVGAAGGAALYYQKQLEAHYPPSQAGAIVDVPHAGARETIRLLHDRNIIQNEYVALAYLALTGSRGKLQAGEYMFDRPMTIPEVLQKLVNGSVYLHKFTVPEGLTIRGIAQKWEEQGFGQTDDFLLAASARESLALIRDLDPESPSVEGYLFPETYSFPSKTAAQVAIAAMVGRFMAVVGKLQKEIPQEQWPLDLRQTVILASLVESEAAVDDERPLIGGVYLNRLSKRILLQCDPTVIYGLEQLHQYNGTLTLKDLRSDSPYNTYIHPGLPPSPISNPGYASLRAAANPAVTKNLYFVRTTEGRHTFSETLAAHNRAVAKYRQQQQAQKR